MRKCKKSSIEYDKNYYLINKEKILSRKKEYYLENRDSILDKAKENQKKNLKSISEKRKKRKSEDKLFKLITSLRCRTSQAFKNKGYRKKSKIKEILGAEIELVKEYIGFRFSDGMNWDNHGEWHIDHIIPLSSANTEEELRKLCHYTNLQPLWASDNLSKGCKIEEVQIKLRI